MSSLIEGPLANHNILLVVADSLRYDVAEQSIGLWLSQCATLHRCSSFANFTLPSHAALFAGFLPLPESGTYAVGDTNYDRLFRSRTARSGKLSVGVRFAGRSVMAAYEGSGRTTVGYGGVQLFDPRTDGVSLAGQFRTFHFAGIPARVPYDTPEARQLSLEMTAMPAVKLAEVGHPPWFIFVNSAATHYPYACRGAPLSTTDAEYLDFADAAFGKRSNAHVPDGFHAWGIRRQEAGLRALDAAIRETVDSLLPSTSPTLLVVLSDHGEAFGENGTVGHGVNHPVVLEVPLWVAEIPAGVAA